ncbi:MAG TPA: hydroxylamine reductase [Phycisphaerae bacterium]|nr:hydroxylamine reductase [Phycisphaerae bacterium]HDZ42637.1 hydroxylamine reductase [Phycisphaerae bacterium]
MFCYQCEQTAKGIGCTKAGVCGKDADTAALQDLLVHAAEGISQYAHRARQLGAVDNEIDVFVIEALFVTVTNVNFDAEQVAQWVTRAAEIKDKAKKLYEGAAGKDAEALTGPAQWQPGGTTGELIAQGQAVTKTNAIERFGPDVAGLQELVLCGLKGTAAYVDHAQIMGVADDGVYAFFHEALDYLAGEPTDVGELTGKALKVGEVNLKAMEMLDTANTGEFGHPEPTEVRVTPVAGKAILISGHDLKDLAELLEQTEGKGINVFTHGEMLPALAYPKLKKHAHLAGNYGGAWQDQRKEFDAFPGAILLTTNCLQKPADSYKGRLFTTGLVRWADVAHIDTGDNGAKDFSPVIEAALAAEGFTADADAETITIGFARNAVMSVADKVIEAVKAGKIRHFFLIGGCDGAKSGRNYYTDLAQLVPDDCVILTLACGKYRFNKLDFGDIGGIPRLLDIGQCNDAHSAVQIAVALAGAFECGVNDLPLSFVLSWYEQKAVCILLSLLHLGIQNIRIGPSLPAFIGPNVLQVLVDTFNLTPISTPQEDLEAMLG